MKAFVNQVCLPDGRKIPRLGQGTWAMGDNLSTRASEIEAIRQGIDLGMTLIDTAEMYGEGASERLVGEAIRPIDRERLFVVSKVYPHNAGREKMAISCKNTLERLGLTYLDCYLLHWRGSVPLRETVECMEALVGERLIRSWGVSNFDTCDMQELWSIPGGDRCVVNQVMYHLGSRGIEYDLMQWMREHHLPVMAYSPIAQAGTLRKGMLNDPRVRAVAQRHGVEPIVILLAFVLHNPDVIAIPKSAKAEHVQINAMAMQVELDEQDIQTLSVYYPAPQYKMHLDFI